MKNLFFAALLSATVTGVHAEAPIMKAGLWEMHTIKQMVDGQDMAAQMAAAQAEMQKAMANMSPQQRQQMEAMMGKRGAASAASSPGAMRMCISQEMAERQKPMVSQDGKCEPTKVTRSGNKTTFEMNCREDGRAVVGKGESVVTSDMVSTRMDMTMSDASGRHTMQSETQMKFLGTDCGGLKPIDQVAREMQAGRKK